MTTMEALSPAKRALLAERLRGRSARPSALRMSGLTRFPLSAEQRHLWLHAALTPELPLYNEGFAIHRRGPLDVAALERALAWFVARHDIWRARLDFAGPEPEFCVEPPFPIRLVVTDLAALPLAAREMAAQRCGAELVLPRFDLGRLPLFRFALVRFAEDDHRLHVGLHHLVFDGVSLGQTLLPELAAAYAAFAAGCEPELPPPAAQYGDYVLWRVATVAGERREELIARWRDVLAGAPMRPLLPESGAATSARNAGCAVRQFAIPPALAGSLRALGHAEGATLYQVLLAAFAVLLRRHGGDDILVASLVDMRRRPEFAHVMGYMLNTVPLRLRPAASPSFRTHLAAVRTAALEAIEASELPFTQILRAMTAGREPGQRPIVNVLFSMQPAPRPVEGWQLAQIDTAPGGAKFDLTLEVEEAGGPVEARFLHPPGRFDAATIDGMAGDYTRLLGDIAADPDRILGDLVADGGPGHPQESEIRSSPAALRGASRFHGEDEKPDERGAKPWSGARRNDAERTERLATIWREVLGVAEVGPEDDFFDLGGHSLLVPAMLSRVAATFGRAVPIADAFRATTLRRFADILSRAPAAKQVDPADRTLMLGFESLGDDCEFGFVQRRHGAEPLSLLRFTGIPPERLAEALEARLEGFDDPALLDLRVDAERDECWIDNRRYGSSYLVFGAARAAETNKFLTWEARKIGVLRKQFLAQLAAGSRICVLKSNEGVAEAVVQRIAAALAALGPAALFWVAEAGPEHQPGEVRQTQEKLFRGWIDHLAPRTAPEDSSPMWLDLCRRMRALLPAPAA